MKTLAYRGSPLTTDTLYPPTRETIELDELRATLKGGHHTYVHYEPGDYTRYDLVLTPIAQANQRAVIVTRLVGGYIAGCAVLWDWERRGHDEFAMEEAARLLSNGNDWTTQLFAWWLTALCTAEV